MAEIIKCPNCQRELRLPEQFLGQKVQCPECQHTFVAASSAVSPQPLATPAAAPEPKPARPRYDDDDDERPHRRRRDEYYDDDDDDFDAFPIARRGRSRLPAHRGGLIMALGLVALVGGFSIGLPALIGPVAWGLGSWDLRQMRDGNMDPEGEGMTRAGQVCGMIATILLILGVSACGLLFWADGGF